MNIYIFLCSFDLYSLSVSVDQCALCLSFIVYLCLPVFELLLIFYRE